MAVFQTIRNFFLPDELVEPEIIVPAPPTDYEIRPLMEKHIKEILRLNLRCFKKGENYTKYTFNYLLNEPRTLSYRVVTPLDQIVRFFFVMAHENGTGHLTTIAVAPEHRRRGLAEKMLIHVENSLRNRDINTITLEVRVNNTSAQSLYRNLNYSIVQRLNGYYSNGEDAFLMVKSLC
jgi:ribosomal-protein-alanine N-acetyltransferase